MKKLESLTISYLTNLEFGQHTKSVYMDITERGESAPPIHDVILNQYQVDLNLKNLAYDKAMVQITKSDETAKIVLADNLRDKALTCIQRYLSVFEFVNDPALLTSYASLNTLFSHYKRMQFWNFEEETNGIDNLVADLQSDKYSNHVSALEMQTWITPLQASNTSFKTIFHGRNQEYSTKEVFDVKQLRSDLKISYETLINYVLTMAKATNTPEFNDALSAINTVRKYYSDMLARRKGEAKTPTPSVN